MQIILSSRDMFIFEVGEIQLLWQSNVARVRKPIKAMDRDRYHRMRINNFCLKSLLLFMQISHGSGMDCRIVLVVIL